MSMFQDPAPLCTGEEVFLGESKGQVSLVLAAGARSQAGLCHVLEAFSQALPDLPVCLRHCSESWAVCV